MMQFVLQQKNAQVSFSSSQGTIISPKEIESNTYEKNVWEANCIMGVMRNSQMARCLASYLLVQVIRPFF